MTRDLDDAAYAESLEEPLDAREIDNIIDDINGIVKVLDPVGFEWAEQAKKERERREMMGSFEDELGAVINRYSQEQASNTPDFILAQFLIGCLAAWNTAVQQRETWYGRDARPGHIVLPEIKDTPK